MSCRRHVGLPRRPGAVLTGLACLAVGAVAVLPGVTQASWASGAELDDATISSGSLRAVPGPVTWRLSHADAGGPIDLNDPPYNGIKAFRIEPGDAVTMAAQFTIEGDGDNVKAQATLSGWELANPGALQGTVYLVRGAMTADETTWGREVLGEAPLNQPHADLTPHDVTTREVLTIYVMFFYPAGTPLDEVHTLDGIASDLNVAFDVDQVR